MTLLWRIRFALRISWIFRESWWKYKKLYLYFGWVVAATIDDELKKMTPEKAALEEVTRWYFE